MPTKEEIRRQILSARRGLKQDEIDRKSRLIHDALLGLPEFFAAGSILLYAALRTEVQMADLIERSLEMGKKVYLPKVVGSKMRVFQVRSFKDDIRKGAFNISEPIPERTVEVAPDILDAVVVPGLAFDEKGARVGFGRGYYDRFLGAFKRKVPFAGFAFEFQMLASVPATADDIPMDYVMTEERTINCQKIF